MMLARRQTNVFLVGFLFMGEGVWIFVNFILRKLFRLIVLVTSTGKYHQSRNKTKFWTKMKNATHAFENVFTVPGSLLLLPFLPGVGLLLLLYLLAATALLLLGSLWWWSSRSWPGATRSLSSTAPPYGWK